MIIILTDNTHCNILVNLTKASRYIPKVLRQTFLSYFYENFYGKVSEIVMEPTAKTL